MDGRNKAAQNCNLWKRQAGSRYVKGVAANRVGGEKHVKRMVLGLFVGGLPYRFYVGVHPLNLAFDVFLRCWL